MKTSIQPYEIEAYFGEYFEDYENQAEALLEKLNWETIVFYMDDKIREKLHFELAPCDNKTFLLAYMMMHAEKYNEDYCSFYF